MADKEKINDNVQNDDMEAKMQALFEQAYKKAEKMAEDIINKAQKKAEQIISNAEKIAASVSVPVTASAPAKKRKPESEPKVRIRLPINPEKGDRIVSVNGKTWIIQRGVEVEVPKYVAEVIENSDRQDELAYIYQEQLSSDFDKKLNQLK